MRVLLSAAGRAFLRSALVAFLALAVGIWSAPDLNQALALAGAASIAALDAGFRAVRVFVPDLSKALGGMVGGGFVAGEVIVTAIQTFLAGFIATALAVLSAPDLGAARAAGLAGLLAIGTALTRVIQAALTPGEPGGPGIKVPPQQVAAESLPPVA